MEHINGYKVTGNCEVDAVTKESLVQHLEEHGIMSLLTSHKFAPFVSCVAKELGRAMAETATPIALAEADDSSETQDKTAPAPGGLQPAIDKGVVDPTTVPRLR